jgi:uncharacterized protein YbjT (DUF2867 family)
MKVVIFGATGMIGQAALKACVADAGVTQILTIARREQPVASPKVKQLLHADFTDFGGLGDALEGVDACLFCLGTTSVGKDEAAYRLVTYDYTMAAARALAARSPSATFVYVSAAGADSSAKGSVMWARVRGEVEAALRGVGLRAVYSVRPAYVQPMDGIVSSTRLYSVGYSLVGALYPALRAVAPSYVLSTREMGAAMVRLAREGSSLQVLESRDMRALVAG